MQKFFSNLHSQLLREGKASVQGLSTVDSSRCKDPKQLQVIQFVQGLSPDQLAALSFLVEVVKEDAASRTLREVGEASSLFTTRTDGPADEGLTHLNELQELYLAYFAPLAALRSPVEAG